MGCRKSGTRNWRITKMGTREAEFGPGRALKKVGLWGLGEPSRLRAGAPWCGRAWCRLGFLRCLAGRLCAPSFAPVEVDELPDRCWSVSVEKGEDWPADGAAVCSLTRVPGS